MATQPQTPISKAEAAERLGCSQKTIDRLRDNGELVAVKSSREQQGHAKITLASLEADEQRQLEAAEPAPAWVDIKKRFPIPELDQARTASAARRAEAPRFRSAHYGPLSLAMSSRSSGCSETERPCPSLLYVYQRPLSLGIRVPTWISRDRERDGKFAKPLHGLASATARSSS